MLGKLAVEGRDIAVHSAANDTISGRNSFTTGVYSQLWLGTPKIPTLCLRRGTLMFGVTMFLHPKLNQGEQE